ncbi:MAG: glycosyltransferase family 9 protein [Bacteroides sp.]|nr:glycosyltransferase family 9 protein [Roseburia sp.]MCM1346455.1 glycosyltransferase family 9 protein [Bacteroides sp.]MCM1421034.1 glycosyltransferase family 9 protein [Bacteroides sp.]
MKKKREIKHILVIRFRRVGDSVLSMALCHSLRLTFPEAEIDFVINKGIHTLYENHPDVDRVITFDDKENHSVPKYLGKVWNVMRSTHYDVIIDMRTTVKTLWFSLFSLTTPFRIGCKKNYGGGILSHRVDNHASGTGDRISQNLMLMDPLAEVAPLRKSREFRLYVDEARKRHFREYMESRGIDFSRPVIMATVTARLEYKVWPKDRMKAILRKIMDCYDAQIIFNFAGKEREMALQYHRELDNDARIFTNIEANSLPDLCALLSNCHFFFGNEGGPRHIAQSLDIPSYAIFPPNVAKQTWLPDEGERFAGISPDDFVPLYRQIAESMDYSQRMGLITVNAVWEGLDKMLSRHL